MMVINEGNQNLAVENGEMGDGALIVAVAIKGNNSKTKGVVRWALQQFTSQEHVVFKLLHVQPRDSNMVSIARQDSTKTVYKKDVDRKTREMLLPSKDMFVHREVELVIMVLESDDAADAISKAVQDHGMSELVIGASSSIIFSWKLMKRSNLSSKISDVTPRFCTIHVISKGKLLNVRKSDIDIETSIADDRSESRFSSDSHSDESGILNTQMNKDARSEPAAVRGSYKAQELVNFQFACCLTC